ncbi:MAG: hypothetical protein JXB29_11770 [Sedimentisphaerales bacterium]|nr:hypothetical protein [Sedimentisphaerales bacterium]
MTQEAESKITVFTVSWYSAQLMEKLFINLNEKAQFPKTIRYLIIDNTAGKDSSLDHLKQMLLPIDICTFDPRGKTGSFAHAAALNFGLGQIQTDFALSIDPDVYVFKKNWDTFATYLIAKQGYSAIGTTYPNWQLGKYHNFPNPVFCFFRTEDFRSINADWTAYSKSPIEDFVNLIRRQIVRLGGLINRQRYQSSAALRKLSNSLENVVGICSHDTGYKIAELAQKGHLKAALFKAVSPDDNVSGSTFNCFRELASQFELYYYENEPILTHKYSTASRIWRTSRGSDTDFWQQCVEKFQKELNQIQQG